MRIAIDAMGGDHAPGTIIDGAVQAARDFDVGIDLVGDEAEVKAALSGYNTTGLDIQVIHAEQVVTMDDSPTQVVRRKRKSSIWMANERVADGTCQAVISAGNTGACMASSLFVLKPLPGVDRPAIAAILPTVTGTSIMVDAGANVDSKVDNLVQFALMGHEYAKRVNGLPSPRVGLLSVGEEESKGSSSIRETHSLLKEAPLNFIGNVEGRDLFSGSTDVIVCDGLVGNVALKASEGLADAMFQILGQEIRRTPLGRLGYLLMKSAFGRFKKKVNYAEYGGAPLLGLNGLSIICHGRSDGWAIRNAVRVAIRMYEEKLVTHISEDLAEALVPAEKAL